MIPDEKGLLLDFGGRNEMTRYSVPTFSHTPFFLRGLMRCVLLWDYSYVGIQELGRPEAENGMGDELEGKKQSLYWRNTPEITPE